METTHSQVAHILLLSFLITVDDEYVVHVMVFVSLNLFNDFADFQLVHVPICKPVDSVLQVRTEVVGEPVFAQQALDLTD